MRQNWFWRVSLLATVALSVMAWQGHALLLRAADVPATPTLAAFVSPLPTPPVVPTPVPAPTPSPQDVAALQYVAQHQGVPLENLEIGQMHRRDYLALDRHFDAYTILERGTSREFRLMIDLSDGSITEDIGAVERADTQARQKRYGKFDRPLYERLQTAGEQDMLPVAIWVGGVRGRSEEELQQVLGSRYPEVRDALARHAPLLDLPDPALVRRVKQEYEQLKRDDIAARIRPLVAYLESQAVPVQSYSLLPSVAVTLTKSALLTLAQREDVEALYLVAGVAEPALDAAIPTNRVVPLWTALNINGVPEPSIPQTIAIVEHGNVALDNTFLHRSGTRLLADNGEFWHTTMVASAAASFHSTYRGMAPGAIILSAGENGTEPYQHFALNWALDQGAVIANLSECHYNNMPDLDWLDRAFDYTARTRHATITTAAGNHRQEYICSPAKGWNVITVGGIHDHGTADWADDTMYYVPGQTPDEGSSYRNPGSPHGDRQKPEVVAPAQDITALELHNNPLTRSGTSLAAPQVAGLAALLMQRNAQLSGQPTAVKAILMASAVHNVESYDRLSDEDGAGSIDAALAGSIAQNKANDGVTCSGPCWWAIGTQSNYPSPGGSLNEYFQASRGERIRVAIAWWSLADPPPTYPTTGTDQLSTDFNLWVWQPSGTAAWGSVSWDNNYEILDFTASETGTYRIEVKKYAASESTNELGIAWVKDATYLPDLRNKDGWASKFYVHNDDAVARTVTINYFYPNGTPMPQVDSCYLPPNWECRIPVNEQNRIPAGNTGSAIVGGGEDVSVVVEHSNGTRYNNYNGISIGGLDPGWGQTGTTIYLPLAKYDFNGKSSRLFILNTGPAATTVTITSYNEAGNQVASTTCPNLAPVARCDLQPPAPAAGRYALRISAGQPLAVVVAEEQHTNPTVVYKVQNAFAGGALEVFAPQVKRRWVNGDFTTLAVQNLGNQSTNVTVIYYPDGGNSCQHTQPINSHGYYIFQTQAAPGCPDAFVGSARVVGGQPLAVLVNEKGEKGHSGFLTGSGSVVLPHVRRDGGWWTGIRVMATAGLANGTISFYDTSGNPVDSAGFSIAQSYHSVNLGNVVPAGLDGSARIIAYDPVVVSGILTLNNSPEQTMMYNGCSR